MAEAPPPARVGDVWAPRGLIVGGWQLAADHGPGAETESVLDGLEALAREGLTTFDCADIYTGVEELLGRLRRRLGADTPLRVHTKYVPDRSVLGRLSRRDVRDALDRSRRRLAVETLDLVQFHWWDWEVPGYVEVAGWLTEMVVEGAVRAVGLTNFDRPRLGELLAAGIPVASQQVQYSIVDRRPERDMAELCRERGIALFAYGVLAGGFLSGRWLGVPEPEAPLPNRSLVKYRLILAEHGTWADFQRLLGALAQVAARHGVSVAGAATRWVLERPAVTAAVLGAGLRTRLDETLAALRMRWSAEDHERLEAARAGSTGPAGDIYALERAPGSPHAAILRTDLNAGSSR